jgi:DNA-binding transcriptional regulator YiaG
MNRKQIIGMKIKEARDNRGLTRYALGSILGVSFESVKHWEGGRNMPSKPRRQAVLDALKIKSKTFFKGV